MIIWHISSDKRYTKSRSFSVSALMNTSLCNSVSYA